MHDRHRTRPILSLLACVGLLVLTACAGDPDLEDPGRSEVSPSPSATSDGPSEPTVTASPSTEATSQDGAEGAADDTDDAAVDAVPSLADACTLAAPSGSEVERIRIAYPEGWKVTGSCEWFDPHATSVEQGTEPDVAVSWYISDSSYARAADVTDEIRDPIHYLGARAGYQASRIQGVSTGRGIREEGTPVVTWLVDLDAGTDEDGGVLVGTAHGTDEVPFDVAVEALDRMGETIVATPAAVPAEGPTVVTRHEGGGQPWTVTLADGCFRLHAGGPDGEVTDENCDVPPPDEEGPATVFLRGDDGLDVLAGLGDPLANRVSAPAASSLFASITIPVEGASAFAMRTRPTPPPLEVTVTGADGGTLATEQVGR